MITLVINIQESPEQGLRIAAMGSNLGADKPSQAEEDAVEAILTFVKKQAGSKTVAEYNGPLALEEPAPGKATVWLKGKRKGGAQ